MLHLFDDMGPQVGVISVLTALQLGDGIGIGFHRHTDGQAGRRGRVVCFTHEALSHLAAIWASGLRRAK